MYREGRRQRERILIFFDIPLMYAALKCPPLTDPDNGQVMAPSISLFSTAVYSCNNGYELMGERERMCFLGFVWTHSAPTCQGRDLGP